MGAARRAGFAIPATWQYFVDMLGRDTVMRAVRGAEQRLYGEQTSKTYLGLAGDGHFGRLNLTHQFYAALGQNDASQFTSVTRDFRALPARKARSTASRQLLTARKWLAA